MTGARPSSHLRAGRIVGELGAVPARGSRCYKSLEKAQWRGWPLRLSTITAAMKRGHGVKEANCQAEDGCHTPSVAGDVPSDFFKAFLRVILVSPSPAMSFLASSVSNTTLRDSP